MTVSVFDHMRRMIVSIIEDLGDILEDASGIDTSDLETSIESLETFSGILEEEIYTLEMEQ